MTSISTPLALTQATLNEQYHHARVGRTHTVHIVYGNHFYSNPICGSGVCTIGTRRSHRGCKFTTDAVTCKKCLARLAVQPQ